MVLVLAGCGGTRTVTVARTVGSTRGAGVGSGVVGAGSARVRPDQVLWLPNVGGFFGRCPRGGQTWTLRFLVAVIHDGAGALPSRRQPMACG